MIKNIFISIVNGCLSFTTLCVNGILASVYWIEKKVTPGSSRIQQEAETLRIQQEAETLRIQLTNKEIELEELKKTITKLYDTVQTIYQPSEKSRRHKAYETAIDNPTLSIDQKIVIAKARLERLEQGKTIQSSQTQSQV